MFIGILFGRVPDEVENLDGNFLCHRLDAIIKLGLTNNYSLESELRFSLNKPCLDVVRPEWGQLHCNSVEQVGGGESGGSSLDDSWISRHGVC